MTAYAIPALLQASWPADNAAPLISSLSPASGGNVSGDAATISASYRDEISGIDTTSAVMLLDDTAVGAQVTSTRINYSAAGLSIGDHSVKVNVADRAGNEAEQTWTFKVTASGGGGGGGSGGGGGGDEGGDTTPNPTPTPTLPPGATDVDSLTDDSVILLKPSVFIHRIISAVLELKAELWL
jgi:hypothetical protein